MQQTDSVVRNTLSTSTIHKGWEEVSSTQDNLEQWAAMELAIAGRLNLPAESSFHEFGCGTARHAISFARMGYAASASDFSTERVQAAQAHIQEEGLGNRIPVFVEDLTHLTFADGAFDAVMAWTVLMHVPSVEKAMLELLRVTKPGGYIIIYENNMRSLDASILRIGVAIKRLFRRAGTVSVERGAYGRESWVRTPAGDYIIRIADIVKIQQFFELHGASLAHHIPGQLTEMYRFLKIRTLNRSVGTINKFYFSRELAPSLACGNILLFQKLDGFPT